MPPVAWTPICGFLVVGIYQASGMPKSRWRRVLDTAVAAYFAADDGQRGGEVELTADLVFTVPPIVIDLFHCWTGLIHSVAILVGIGVGLPLALRDGPCESAEWAPAMALAALTFGQGNAHLAGMIGAIAGLDGIVRALLLEIFIAGVVLGWLLARVLDRKQIVGYGPHLSLRALLTLILT